MHKKVIARLTALPIQKMITELAIVQILNKFLISKN